MTFTTPAALALLIVVPLLATLLIWRIRLRQQLWATLAIPSRHAFLFPGVRTRRRFIKLGIWLAALTLLIIAIARPTWGSDLNIIETQGASIVFLLDVSNSMAAQDLIPNRLERAKLTIRDLFTELQGNEVGLVLFAGTAVVQLPLTTDTLSAVNFLNSVSTNAITQQGTDLESAVDMGRKLFDENSPSARMMVILTDGENHEGDTDRAVQAAIEDNIIIHAVGYGDPDGAPIPEFDASGNLIDYKTDAENNVILSRLDEATLEQIASSTGGIYQRATASGVEAVNLVNRIREADLSRLEVRQQQRGVERFGIFVLLALLLLTIEILIPEHTKP